MTVTTAEGDGSNSCVKTTDGSGKLCHTLTGEMDDMQEDVATVCVELVDSELKVSFEATGDWVMVTNKFWYDEDVSTIPRLSDGSVDMEAFDYYICNSTGFNEWTFPNAAVDLSDCSGASSLDLAMVAYAEVEKYGTNGKLVRSSAQKVFAYEHSVGYGSSWLGWFDFQVSCECGEDTPVTAHSCPSDATPELYLKSAVSPECHAIVAGGDQQSMKAGSVCVAVVDGKLDVTFVADDLWALIRSQVWVGQDTGGDAALASMPMKASGVPDTKKFKNFACDWEGEKEVSFTVDMKYECIEEEETVKFFVVAHSKVEQVDEAGELIPGTELDVFAFEHSGDSEKWYGWFDFEVGCRCAEEPTLPPSDAACEDMTLDDVAEKSYDLTATEAWDSDAGKVSVSVEGGNLIVTFEATNYWAIFGTAVVGRQP